MKLQITTEILGSYPELGVAYLIGESVDNHAAAASIAQAIASEIEALRGRFADPAALSEHPVIASWQRAYRSMGLNPKRTPPTAQALLRRVLKGGAPPSLSPVVDAYLLAELRFFVPIGGYDLDALQGDVVLRTSPGGEPFVGIGADAEEQTEAGEVVYADARSVLTRRWNFRDADRTKISATTRRFVLCAEAAYEDVPREALLGAMEDTRASIAACCGGAFAVGLLDARTPEVALP